MSKLKFTLDRDTGVLRVFPQESLDKEDFLALSEAVDGFLDQGGSLSGLVIDSERFPGWDDMGAFLAHVRFVREHHKLIPRVAVISDDSMLSAMPAFANHFVAADVRHFSVADCDDALSWVMDSKT